MADKQLLFDILAKDRASDAFKSAGRSADKLGDDTDKMSGRVKAAMAVGATAIAGFALKLGGDAVAAAKESMQVGAQTEAALKSTGAQAWITGDQIGDYAHKLQMMSGVSDETIQSGQNMLLTFTNIRNEVGAGNDIFNQATAALLDMSVATGQDASSAAVQLGKALNDPIAGVSALSRVGVQFTEEQKAQIQAMVAAGDVMGAQKIILGELTKQFGGSAKAQGDAMTAGERLSMRWGDMQEQLGTWLIPKINATIEALMKSAEWIGRNKDIVIPATAAITGMAVAVGATSAALSIATAAAAAFGVTLNVSLGPVYLIAAAIGALAAGIVYAYFKFEAFRNIVDTVGRFIGGAVKLHFEIYATIFRAIGDAAAFVVRQVDRMADAIRDVPKPPSWLMGGLKMSLPGIGALGSIAGAFDAGGIVPGPIGSPQLVVAHGGETFIPTHKPGFRGAGGGWHIENLTVQAPLDIDEALNRMRFLAGGF